MDAFNTTELESMAKSNPKYTKYFLSWAKIDAQIKKMVTDMIEAMSDYPSDYYIKTTLSSMSYDLYLYSQEDKVIVGKLWPVVEFLKICQSKTIEAELQHTIKAMLLKFEENDLKHNGETNWIYT